MFQRNDALLSQYAATFPHSRETLVNFGGVPADSLDREDWSAEISHFLNVLSSRGYQFQPAMFDGDSGICPLYTVRLDKGDFQGAVPVDLHYFQWIVNKLCHKEQRTEIRERMLDIHVLGDGQTLGEHVTLR